MLNKPSVYTLFLAKYMEILHMRLVIQQLKTSVRLQNLDHIRPRIMSQIEDIISSYCTNSSSLRFHLQLHCGILHTLEMYTTIS